MMKALSQLVLHDAVRHEAETTKGDVATIGAKHGLEPAGIEILQAVVEIYPVDKDKFWQIMEAKVADANLPPLWLAVACHHAASSNLKGDVYAARNEHAMQIVLNTPGVNQTDREILVAWCEGGLLEKSFLPWSWEKYHEIVALNLFHGLYNTPGRTKVLAERLEKAGRPSEALAWLDVVEAMRKFPNYYAPRQIQYAADLRHRLRNELDQASKPHVHC